MHQDCLQTRRELAPEPGPRLASETSEPAVRHLDQCAECRAFFAAQRALVSRVHAAGRSVDPPPHLRDSVLAHLGPPEIEIRSGHRLWWQGVAVAAAAVTALWLGPVPIASGVTNAQPFVMQALADDHAVDALETDEPTPLAAWFAARAMPVEIPAIPNASMWRGRITSVGGRPSAAIDFHIEGGIEFTYILVPDTDVFSGMTNSDIMTMSSSGWEVAMWAEGGTARAVVSTMGRDALMEIARHCRDKRSI